VNTTRPSCTTAAVVLVSALLSAVPTASSTRPSTSVPSSPPARLGGRPTTALDPHVLQLAMGAASCARAQRDVRDASLLTIIDYSLPSTEKRLWVIDVAKRQILFHELVAHGQNSGEAYAVDFSNRPGSRQSSLGLFRTEDVYDGGHGESLRLIGLEPGINDRAEERRIVMHGAVYVNERVVQRFGKLGRSWGCPAVDRAVFPQILRYIKDGTGLFVYYPDPRWLQQSRFLQCDANLASK
jgi:hypothetical protein